MRAVLAALLFTFLPFAAVAQMADDQVSLDFALSAKTNVSGSASMAIGGVLGRQSSGSLLGIDSLPNWSSYFYLPGVIDNFGDMQFTWQYTMVGHAPFGARGEGEDSDWQGGTTRIGAPIVPVNIDLRNFDGSPRYFIFPNGHQGPRMYLDATKYVTPVLKSPIFSKFSYSSSEDPTQYTDAVQRAEFFHSADEDWHTILKPRVAAARTMVLIRGTYRFAVYPDGTLAYVLVDANTFVSKLFPPNSNGTDTTTVIGSAESTGDVRTTDMSTFLFPDTYLYTGGNPRNCCILGFHTYDLEAGTPANGWREKRYVLNYSSWISPGIFRGGFQDVTAVSHELSESFNDPFVNNSVPWWLAPNGNCQNNLEDGDVIEGLPNAVFPITLNGFTYHPQNEALLQWFADQTPSSAIHGAYSYPDESVLPTGATPQLPGCPAPKP